MAIGNSINEQTTGVVGFTGTGFTATPVTQYDVIVGGSTSSTLSSVGPGSAGQVLRSGGNAANPAYSTATYPATAGTSGNVLTSDGTNWNSTAPASLVGFSANASANISNVSGDGTQYQILFDQTSLDTASAFNTSTGLYTFPNTGLWLITGLFFPFNLGVGHTLVLMSLQTTSINYGLLYFNPVAMASGTQINMTYSTIIQATVGETAYLKFEAAGSTKTVGIGGGALGASFNGVLLNA
jgi:hypothetical protein